MHKKSIADQERDKMLKANITEPSNSPWAAPIVLVKKRGGITWFSVDFRMLNNVTIKDAYSLPRITRHAFWHQILLNLDLARGYSQVAMDESDEVKTAFATHKGLFQFNVLPFGLSNSPVAFEGLMEAVLSGLQWEKCLVYVDDIITFGATFEDTLKNLTVIFDRLRTADLKLKKCTLFQEQVECLGHTVSQEGIRCNPDKISAVMNWHVPTSVSEVRSFIGLASYYWRFINNFSHVAYPFTRLTQTNKMFEWSEECQNAFNTLKHLLTTAPVLSHPSTTDTFIFDTVGAVLSQMQNGEEVDTVYGSKILSRSQMGYCTTYQKLLQL